MSETKKVNSLQFYKPQPKPLSVGTTLLQFIIILLPLWAQASNAKLRYTMDWDEDLRFIQTKSNDLVILRYWKRAWRDDIDIAPVHSSNAVCEILKENEVMGHSDFIIRVNKISPGGFCSFGFTLRNFEKRQKTSTLVTLTQWDDSSFIHESTVE